MALTPNFTSSQSSGTPNIVSYTDSSTGSDAAITQRRIYLLQADGTYLVTTGTTTDYMAWAYASSSKTFDVLTQDTALTVTVQWLDVNNVVLYTKELSFNYTDYNETFYYGLTQSQVAITNPMLAASTNYFQNKMKLRVLIDSADQAISFASDIYSAQVSNDLATYLVTNADFNF